MPIGVKCSKCGKNTAQDTAICSKCGSAYPLCNICGGASWNQSSCPGCGISSPGWKWAKGGGSGGVVGGTIPAPAYRDAWAAKKDEIAKEREQEGPASHRGVKLPEEEVAVLRQIEDRICKPLVPLKDDGDLVGSKEEGGHVTKLNLIYADIISLPDDIGKLKHLKELIHIGGGFLELTKFPDSMGDLENLEVLVLEKARIFDFPKTLTKLKKLKKVNMSSSLQDDRAINVITQILSIEELNMSFNRHCRGSRSKLFNLVNLKKLNIRGFPGVDRLPANFFGLSTLEELDVVGTGLNFWMGAAKKMAKWPLRKIYIMPDQKKMGWKKVQKIVEGNGGTVEEDGWTGI